MKKIDITTATIIICILFFATWGAVGAIHDSKMDKEHNKFIDQSNCEFVYLSGYASGYFNNNPKAKNENAIDHEIMKKANELANRYCKIKFIKK